ncbi:hypothetical protein VNO78_22173 [Psophocarpus tetragonolobus]|uniref:Uncharacterized protein n=1 Tax=Psophocarpus tetragonolobus TaxID=3891 RepID=A0AAN9SD48_PSOTE
MFRILCCLFFWLNSLALYIVRNIERKLCSISDDSFTRGVLLYALLLLIIISIFNLSLIVFCLYNYYSMWFHSWMTWRIKFRASEASN